MEVVDSGQIDALWDVGEARLGATMHGGPTLGDWLALDLGLAVDARRASLRLATPDSR